MSSEKNLDDDNSEKDPLSVDKNDDDDEEKSDEETSSNASSEYEVVRKNLKK